MENKSPKFAPKEIFDKILEWSVIPTFDLVIQYGDQGIIFVKRKIAPYKNQWALPGLRMLKGEKINDTLKRIAKNEVGLIIDPNNKKFIAQYDGMFKTEQGRQDISTGYMVSVDTNQEVQINRNHFIDFQISKKMPKPIGAMYKYYFEKVSNEKNR